MKWELVLTYVAIGKQQGSHPGKTILLDAVFKEKNTLNG